MSASSDCRARTFFPSPARRTLEKTDTEASLRVPFANLSCGVVRGRWPQTLLAGAITVYIVVFATLTWQQQSNYGTFGYDMGLHDQGIWLTSRFIRPFVTIRGMHYFGHHVNLVSLLYVPAYWLGAGPHFLYLTETIWLAVGAIPVWLLARDRLPSRGAGWWALVPSAAYLMYPSVEWMNWWHWHPDTMAITPLLFAWWFATRRRWGWFVAAVALALSTKEDVALAVLMLGVVLVVVRRERRAGIITAVAGLSWFLACTRVVIPGLLHGIPFYERHLFPAFGTSLGSVLVGMATHPGRVLSMAAMPDRLIYYLKLLAPLGFVPLFGLPLLLIAGPQMGVNVLSALPGTHDIRFQYSAVVVAALFIATVEGVAWLHRLRPILGRAALVLVAVNALGANIAYSPSPLGHEYHSGIWAGRIGRHAVFDRAVAMVPRGAGVAATYYLIPHLTHRRYAYEWPNPWIVGNWGLAGEPPPAPATVDYVVLDLTLGQQPALLDSLIDPQTGAFDVVLRQDSVLVAKRRAR